MFTWGSKYLVSTAGLCLVVAALYGVATGGDPVGVVSLGYKGGVGDHYGYATLLAAACAFLLTGVAGLISREGIKHDRSTGKHLESSVLQPTEASIWPVAVAFSLASVALGFAFSAAFLVLGVVILCVAAMEWALVAWADKISSDEHINETVRGRVMGPFEVPIFSLLISAFVVLSVSRVLLAVSAIAATAVAMVVATIVFVLAIAFAKDFIPKRYFSGILAAGVLVTIVGGIAGATIGERDFHHGEAHETQESHNGVEEEGVRE